MTPDFITNAGTRCRIGISGGTDTIYAVAVHQEVEPGFYGVGDCFDRLVGTDDYRTAMAIQRQIRAAIQHGLKGLNQTGAGA